MVSGQGKLGCQAAWDGQRLEGASELSCDRDRLLGSSDPQSLVSNVIGSPAPVPPNSDVLSGIPGGRQHIGGEALTLWSQTWAQITAPPVWAQASHFLSLSLSFVICKARQIK